MHTRHKCVCAHFDMHVDVHVHVFASCARVYAHIFSKICLVVHYSVMNLRIIFHKDPMFRCWDICKKFSIVGFLLHIVNIYNIIVKRITEKYNYMIKIFPIFYNYFQLKIQIFLTYKSDNQYNAFHTNADLNIFSEHEF